LASAAAQRYFNAQSPADQAAIRASWNGADLTDEWYQNAVNAGAVSAPIQGTGAPTTAAEAQEYARGTGQPEDYLRFRDPDFERWAPYWDAASGRYRSSRGAEGIYDKPTECPPGMVPSGPNETDPCVGGAGAGEAGGGGGVGGGGYGAGTTYGGGVGGPPSFQYTKFNPPLPSDVTLDPSYQFRVNEGQRALEHSAAARGTLRTSGTLQDIVDYGQEAASQEYGNIFKRAAQTYGLRYQGEKDYFAPQYGGWQTQYGGDLARWQTQYGGDLSKYLAREGNIFALLNQPAPQAPYYG
jgi:hypothetical protein